MTWTERGLTGAHETKWRAREDSMKPRHFTGSQLKWACELGWKWNPRLGSDTMLKKLASYLKPIWNEQIGPCTVLTSLDFLWKPIGIDFLTGHSNLDSAVFLRTPKILFVTGWCKWVLVLFFIWKLIFCYKYIWTSSRN